MHTVCANSVYVYIWSNILSRVNLNLCHDKNCMPRKTKYIHSQAMKYGAARLWAGKPIHFQGSMKELCCLFLFLNFLQVNIWNCYAEMRLSVHRSIYRWYVNGKQQQWWEIRISQFTSSQKYIRICYAKLN